jgi:cytochrome c-type biogenesis protein CcmF
MDEYSMIYKGMRKLTREAGMVDENLLSPTSNPLEVIRLENNRYDTLSLISPENSYFEVEYHNDQGKQFTLFPRVQINESMNMTVYSPDIRRTFNADMYTHVRTFPKPTSEEDWSEPMETKVAIGSTFFINDYVATLEKLEPLTEINGNPLDQNDVAVKAVINVQGEYKDYTSEPIFIIKDREFIGRVDDHVNDLAFTISIQNILPNENAVVFVTRTTQKDWIIMEAVKKPWINLLWIGTFLLVIGFVVAINRRYTEFIKMRDKGVEA